MKTYLCVTIDTECDKGPHWKTQYPLAFEAVRRGVGEVLQPLFDRYGCAPTYLLSPEVIADRASAELFATLGTRAELATHLHGEFAVPSPGHVEATHAYQRDYPKEVEAERLEFLTEQFRAAFDSAPTSFRAGRFGIGPNTLPILESLGYVVDSSVTPGINWSVYDGPNFMGAPTQPYHPDPTDFTKRGASNVLEVPMTIHFKPWGRLPKVGPRWGEIWLRPTSGSLRRLGWVIDKELEEARHASAPQIMTLMFHNVEVLPETGPYATTPAAVAMVLRRLEFVLQRCAERGVEFVTLTDVARLVEPLSDSAAQ
ncbi:MAG: hypothetical protein ABIQ73_24530 [Acidimicrobiales bacterium]